MSDAVRYSRFLAPGATGALLTLLLSFSAHAQDEQAFNDIEAAVELQDFSLLIATEDIDVGGLNNVRSRVNEIEITASACAEESSAARTRLEKRFVPLTDLDPEASQEMMDQRREVRAALDEAIAQQARCEGMLDATKALLTTISDRQNELSQQFLSRKSLSVFALIKSFPSQVAKWPSRVRESLTLDLVMGLTPFALFWLLIFAGAIAAFAGILARRKFGLWYEAAGGDDAPPQMKYLFTKPLAEFAPLWLEGAALLLVLTMTIPGASSDMLVIRAALAIFAFGLSCVVVNWVTGPLSPSSDIKGLIPDHVAPMRLRMHFVVLTVCVSYVVLGSEWSSVRETQPYIVGRASMIFLIATALLFLLTYLGRIPGLRNRYKALRYLAVLTTVVAIIALLSRYQNLSGYLVQGIVRTALALFLLWIFLWLVYAAFNYLIEQESSTASQVRTTLGISDKSTGTGIGFMQLIADMVLWISTIVYLIYVWDTTGSTLDKLRLSVVEGWELGGVSIVPKDVIGGILVFLLLIVLIGWIKRWVDRRWLQRVMIERGARDAILTLFGYVAFILAIVIALRIANVDLTGLAWISAALALGLGFGMQGIANNFVSGLILLFERPIRAGDFVTIGEIEGFVRSIRIRATEIETLDNQNVLVPNSELVSGRVTNWVLHDTHGRLQVQIGVAYGSDVEKVRDILETIAREHAEVITDGRAPAPRALFMGFGDSSLDFELRVRIQRIERRFSVMSDLNFEIDRAFREAGITIPFPQRDLHIVSYPEPPQKTAMPKAKRDTKTAPPTEDITRSHEASIETARDKDEVWAAITEIDILKRWLARDGSFTAQIGGLFDLSLRDGFAVSGQIDIYIPTRRLRAVLSPLDDEEPLPTGPITIDFQVREIGDNTQLTITVAGIPGSEDWEEYYRLSVDRWQAALTELKSDVLRK